MLRKESCWHKTPIFHTGFNCVSKNLPFCRTNATFPALRDTWGQKLFDIGRKFLHTCSFEDSQEKETPQEGDDIWIAFPYLKKNGRHIFCQKKKDEKMPLEKKKQRKVPFQKRPIPRESTQTAGNPGAIKKEKAVSCDRFIHQPPESPRPVEGGESRPRFPKKRPPKKSSEKTRGKMVAWHFGSFFWEGGGKVVVFIFRSYVSYVTGMACWYLVNGLTNP